MVHVNGTTSKVLLGVQDVSRSLISDHVASMRSIVSLRAPYYTASFAEIAQLDPFSLI